METFRHLRDEISALKAQLASQAANHQQRVLELTIEIAALKRQLFGPKSERVHHQEAQMQLLLILEELGRFNNGDVDAGDRAEALLGELRDEADKAATPVQPPVRPTKTRKPPKRRKLELSDLPVERIVLEPFERTGPGGENLVKIGEEVSHHVDHRPGSLVRVEVVRPKYLRPADVATAASSATSTTTSVDESEDGPAPLVNVIVADTVELPIAKGMAGPGLLARVLVSKYGDHLPLHRQEGIFKREGLVLARSTLCGFVQGAVRLLAHVVEAMWLDAKQNSPLILTDAAGVLIRDKGQCRRGHFQVFIAPSRHVVFKFLAKNDGDSVAKMLAGFGGKLQSDASSIYHELLRREEDIVEVGCWAHARRNFFKALALDRERALVGIGFVGALYDAHDGAKDAGGAVDGEKRKALARPVLDDLKKWIARERPKLKAPSLIEVALGYVDRQWTALTRFLDDATLRLDNNPSELELRHQVVGRKNWLFCATDGGAHWNAVVVSLIASCRMHDVEPWAYLRDVLTLLPSWSQNRALELAPSDWRKTLEQPEVSKLLENCRLLGRRSGHSNDDGGASAPAT